LYYLSCTFTNIKNNKIIIVSFLAATLLFSVYVPVQVIAAEGFEVNNLGLSVDTSTTINGNLVAFAVFERFQGNTDLNGDGDAFDKILHIYDHSTGVTTNLKLSFDPGDARMFLDGNLVAFAVREASQNNTDLNGDGNTEDDQVIHVIEIISKTFCNDMTIDELTSSGNYNVIDGTNQNDILQGTSGDDLIFGKEGDDLILGNGGNDCILGNDGNDMIYGSTGDD